MKKGKESKEQGKRKKKKIAEGIEEKEKEEGIDARWARRGGSEKGAMAMVVVVVVVGV